MGIWVRVRVRVRFRVRGRVRVRVRVRVRYRPLRFAAISRVDVLIRIDEND